MLYIAYGSNMNVSQMKDRCRSAQVVGTAYLKDYTLAFRGRPDSAVATIEPRQGGSVPVVIWDISPSDEAALDRYEGWPTLYRKEHLEVMFQRKPIIAMAYILNEGRPAGNPGLYYYRTILQGYRDAGFDPRILRKALECRPEEPHLSGSRKQKSSFIRKHT